MGDKQTSRARRRLNEAAIVLEARWPALLDHLVTVAETSIATELAAASEKKTGESFIPG